MKKGISIIIPTYNRKEFIKETIQSVLDQDYEGNLEIIISDDGSTDDTLAIARLFGSKVKIIEKSKDCLTQGAAGARNRGIRASTQPYVCFLDSDDFFLPHHLKKIVAILEKKPQTGFAFCRVLDVKEENGLRLFKPWTLLHVFRNDIINLVVSTSRIVQTNSLMFKKEVFENIGCFDESYSDGEDGDMWMRVSECCRCEFSEHYGVAYRTNHGISHQIHNNPKEKRLRSYLKVFENALNRNYKSKLIKGSYREYKLKMIVLSGKSQYKGFEKKWRKYLLIARFPISYLRDRKYKFVHSRDLKKMQEWHDLKFFVPSI